MLALSSFIFGEIPLVNRTMAALAERPKLLEAFLRQTFRDETIVLSPEYDWVTGAYLLWRSLVGPQTDTPWSDAKLELAAKEFCLQNQLAGEWWRVVFEIAKAEFDFTVQSDDTLFVLEFKNTGGLTRTQLDANEVRQVRKHALAGELLKQLEPHIKQVRLAYVSPGLEMNEIRTFDPTDKAPIKLSATTKAALKTPVTFEALKSQFNLKSEPVYHISWQALVGLLGEWPETAPLASRLRANPALFPEQPT